MTDADSPKSPSHAKLPEEGEGGDGFTKVLTKEEKRKQRKVDRHRPQFQFDTSYYRNGKKIGIAVSSERGVRACSS